MKVHVGRLAAAGFVVGLLGLGGAGYAYAQSSSTTPAPTTPGNGQGHSSANCPNMGPNNSQSSSTQM
jgi:hypothetical protein